MNEDRIEMDQKQSFHELISRRDEAKAIAILIDCALCSKSWKEFILKAVEASTALPRNHPEHNEVLRRMSREICNPSSKEIPEQLKQYIRDHYTDAPYHQKKDHDPNAVDII